MNEKEQYLTITIKDFRPDDQRSSPEKPRERTLQFRDHQEYLKAMAKIGRLRRAKLRETTRTTVEIYPLEDEGLFDRPPEVNYPTHNDR